MARRSDRRETDVPDKAVRDALRNVLASSEFGASERLPRFLKFIVEETLAGRGDTLKGYVIGLEVFDKPADFNPEQDSVVRVEAVRLRRALQSYYLSEGQEDPVFITVPKGAYRPVFGARSAEPGRRAPDPTGTGGIPTVKIPLAAGIAIWLLLTALGVAGGIYLVMTGGRVPSVTGSLPSARPPADNIALPSGPKLAVLPFSASGMSNNIRIAQSFHAQLISDLTRFDMLAVIGADSVSMYFGQIADLQPVAERYGAQYVMAGMMQLQGDDLRIIVNLYDARKRQYLWTTRFDRTLVAKDILKLQSDLSARVAAEIGQTYGIINRAETRQFIGNPPKIMSSYQCVLRFRDHEMRKTPEEHEQLRSCLEQTVERDPEYAQAWSALASVYRRDGVSALERAEEAARTAVRLAPDSATAHLALARVMFDKGDAGSAEQHLRIALDRNPNDAPLLASAGRIFSLLGEWEFARKLIEKARFLNPGHPPWYDGVLFAIYFSQRKYRMALENALEFRKGDSLRSHIAATASYGKLGDPAASSRALAALIEKYPKFPLNSRNIIAGWGYGDAFVEDCLDGLRGAGLVNLF